MMDVTVGTIEQICVLVAIAFVMARTHVISPSAGGDRRASAGLAAFVLFLAMALTEEFVARRHGQLSARIVTACASGLLAGPAVGLGVGLATALLRQIFGLTPPLAFGIILGAGGLVGGLVHQLRPAWSLRLATGMILGASVTGLRFVLTSGLSRVIESPGPPLPLDMEVVTALVNGLGVAVILKVFEQVRDLEGSSRAAAMSEVRALQARMHPHFLFNALNSISALAAVSPEEVPQAVARLGRFLRASLEQHDNATIPLREELDIVAAYLDIEKLRFGDRLRLETDVEATLLEWQVPPFLIQPLAENAVRHGLHPLPQGGVVRISARAEKGCLVLAVEDTGVGLKPEAASRLRPGSEPESHAVSLLRRRLEQLYGRSHRFEVIPRQGGGTLAEVRLPANPDRRAGR